MNTFRLIICLTLFFKFKCLIQGDSIHAIVDEHDFDHTEKMKEGCAYDIYHVHVKHNSFGYKILNRELEIGFNEMSKIVSLNEDSCSIPKYAFEFLQYNEVEECYNRQLKEDKEQKRVVLAGKLSILIDFLFLLFLIYK